jgi:eukaryotic-like serine/threonine-protein kinase
MATCPKCGTRYASTVKICTHDGTVLNDDPATDAHIGKLLDGKYRLDSFLSQGGMGAVYKATHVMLDKTVVVKLIKPELVTSAEVVRRFQREARAASNLNHPNIVQVFDLGQTDDGTLYIAMEFIDGPSLKDVIKRTGSLPVARIQSILGQVCSALALAHGHNIIHRDLKPHNVMLAKGPGGQEVAKLLDFGIAKTFEDGGTQLTQTGFAIGTPQYMAPEQAAGKEVTPQSDLYSVGVMLYEMLVGEVPFDAPTTAAILIKQLTEAPQPPSRRKPEAGVSAVLEAITMRCLDKEPERRFPSAEAFAQALKNADDDETKSRASDAPTRGMPIPSRSATTIGGPVATTPVPAPAAPTHVASPVAASPGPTHPAPVSGVTAPPPAAAPMAAQPIPPPPVLAAPLPVAAPPNEGTRPTVPGSAMPVATAPPPPSSSSRTGLWITLGAVAVLVAAVAALQLGLLPGQNANNNGAQQAQSTPAPQASPASADPSPAATSPAAAAAPAAPATPFRAEAAPPAAPQASASSTPPSAATQQPSAAPPARASASVASAASGSTPPTSAAAPVATSRPAPTPAVTPAASPGRTPQPAPAPSVAAPAAAAAPAQAARSENPTVFLRCEGFAAICNALRASLLEQFQKHNILPVREPNRAAIVLTGNVEVVQERVSREFGQAMQTRTYTVDVSGETRDGSPVSMPPPRTFSFDAQFGRERLDENARLIASDVTDKIRAFWNK